VTAKKAKSRLSGSMDEHQAKELLKTYDIPVVKEVVALDTNDALSAALSFGYPVVIKGLGTRLQHKTERGLVHLNIHDDDALIRAAKAIRRNGKNDLEGLLVQPQISGKRELMVGLIKDPQFGPVVLFGVGGVLTEAIDDVSLALAPFTEHDAGKMIDGIKAQRLLGAFRGEALVDRSILVRILLGLSRLAVEHPEIDEIDINPLRVDSQGSPWAVDALVIAGNVQEHPVVNNIAPEAIGKLFYPRSIAFIGASSQLGKWGHMLVANTISGGYQGDIHLVNAKGGTIMGQTAYKDIADIPGPVDLAVVTVPAHKVLDLLEPLRTKKIPSMVLITSGFRETGAEGMDLENRLTLKARQSGILILGPNTMGITNPHINLYCTGAKVAPSPGSTAMVAQSGNMGSQLLLFAERQGIGIRGFAGSGNEAMITIEDYLEGFEIDDLTRVVILYIESIKNGRRFFDAARRVSQTKPIILLKGGQSEAGKKAAAGHTGAMASDNRVFDAVCRQAGIIKVDAPMQLLDLAAAFASLPLPKGPRVAIMTWGGGWGVVTADLCQRMGLEVPELDPSIIHILDALLPPYWSRANPVDLVGEQNLSLPLTTLEALMQWEGCDAVINLGIMGRIDVTNRVRESVMAADPGSATDILDAAHQMVTDFEEQFIRRSLELMDTYGKPVIGVSISCTPESKTVYEIPGATHKVVIYETPEKAVLALSKMIDYQQHRDHSPIE
jgi:acyl-CoA synthetase (NDP forming)